MRPLNINNHFSNQDNLNKIANIKKRFNLIYFILFIFTFCSIILMFYAHFVFINRDLEIHLNEVPNKLPILGSKTWFTIFLYFTFQSNFLVVVYFFLMCFYLMDPFNKRRHKIFETIILINIICTMLFYWLFIFPFLGNVWDNFIKISNNLLVHLINPLLMIFSLYIFYQKRCVSKLKLGKKDFIYIFIYPAIYLVIIYIIFFVTRKETIQEKPIKVIFKDYDVLEAFKKKYATEAQINIKHNNNALFLFISGYKQTHGLAVYPFINFDTTNSIIFYSFPFIFIFIFSLLSSSIFLFLNKWFCFKKIVIKKTK